MGRAVACRRCSAGSVAGGIRAGTPRGSIATLALGGSVRPLMPVSIGCGSTWACAVAGTSCCSAHGRGSCGGCGQKRCTAARRVGSGQGASGSAPWLMPKPTGRPRPNSGRSAIPSTVTGCGITHPARQTPQGAMFGTRYAGGRLPGPAHGLRVGRPVPTLIP